jgi:hypothetical protein
MMLHFGLVVDIDRYQNSHVNVSIYKFLIEDVQDQDSVLIAQPFRVSQ